VEQLRRMIRSHVVDRDEDVHNIPVHTFQPSDLLILRLLTGMPVTRGASSGFPTLPELRAMRTRAIGRTVATVLHGRDVSERAFVDCWSRHAWRR
jgi:hypothetical protein